jgi:hypothetical protein
MVVHVALDVNGVLVQRKWSGATRSAKRSADDHVLDMHPKKGWQHVLIRPFALDLLRVIESTPGAELVFWSSMTHDYMQPIVNLLTRLSGITEFAVMTQADCTPTQHPEVRGKPLFCKDAAQIYARYPESEGVVFIDDSALKMRYNAKEVVCILGTWDGLDKDDVELAAVDIPALLNQRKSTAPPPPHSSPHPPPHPSPHPPPHPSPHSSPHPPPHPSPHPPPHPSPHPSPSAFLSRSSRVRGRVRGRGRGNVRGRPRGYASRNMPVVLRVSIGRDVLDI